MWQILNNFILISYTYSKTVYLSRLISFSLNVFIHRRKLLGNNSTELFRLFLSFSLLPNHQTQFPSNRPIWFSTKTMKRYNFTLINQYDDALKSLSFLIPRDGTNILTTPCCLSTSTTNLWNTLQMIRQLFVDWEVIILVSAFMFETT